jgi:hypothetical protein
MESGDNMNPVSKIKRIGNEHTGIYLLAQSYMAQRIFFKYRTTEKKKFTKPDPFSYLFDLKQEKSLF